MPKGAGTATIFVAAIASVATVGRGTPASAPGTSEDHTQGAASGAAVLPGTLKLREALKERLCGLRPEAKTQETFRDCLPDRNRTSFLIATIPDPETTHLALYTDREIESIISAANDSDYLFQTYDLPWKTEPEKEIPRTADREIQKIETEERRQRPGFLIFRDKDRLTPSRVLIVLLVPESPVSGVDLRVLDSAFETLRETDPNRQIPVLGPVFSGSLAPLIEYLGQRGNRPFEQMRSASATDFNACLKDRPPDAGGDICQLDSDRSALDRFMEFRKKYWWDGAAAILSEDKTLYGGGLMDKGEFMNFRYPREIARLRNVYEDASQPAASGQSKAQDSNQFTLKGSYSPDSPFIAPDSPPAFSPVQSPASQQAALASIGNSLRREHTRYLGVTATDVLDLIFLSSFVRKSFPEMRVFTLDSDLLFLRAAENAPLTGMLSVTNYPLFLHNQYWTSHPPGAESTRKIQFTSRQAESTYNLATKLLYSSLEDKSKPPHVMHRDTASGVSDPDCKPRLWLTTLGHVGYWPVALLDDRDGKDESGYLRQSGEAPSPGHPSHLWSALFLAIVLFAFLHCWYTLEILFFPYEASIHPVRAQLRRFCRRVLLTSYPARVAGEKAGEQAGEQRAFLFTVTLAIFSALWLIAMIALRLPGSASFGTALTLGLAGVAMFFLLLVSGSLAVKNFPKPARWRVGGISSALAALLTIAWGSMIWNRAYDTGLFAAYRSISLTNGVSPVLPLLLLCVGGAGWGWMQLRRASAIEARQLMTTGQKGTGFPGFENEVEKVDNAIKDIFSWKIWTPALAVFIIWFGVGRACESLHSMELKRYDVLMIFCLGIIEWLTCLSWVQFIRVWGEFHRYLQALERGPFRSAFSRLGKQIDWLPLVTAPREHPLLITTRCVETLKALRKLYPGRQVFNLIPPMEQLLAQIGDRVAEAHEPSDDDYRSLQTLLRAFGDRFYAELSANEWRDGSSISIERETKSDSKVPLSFSETSRTLREEFLAFRHLMYMRYVLRHLRNLVGFVAGGFIISLLAISSYPFQGQHWLAFTGIIAFVAFGIGVGVVFAQMDKDAMMSRITETKADELNWTFFWRLARFGALPLLTVATTQFPWIRNFLSSWIQPALEAMH